MFRPRVPCLVSLLAAVCLAACTASTRDSEDSSAADTTVDTMSSDGQADTAAQPDTAVDSAGDGLDADSPSDSAAPDAPDAGSDAPADNDTVDAAATDGSDIADGAGPPGPGATWQVQLFDGFDATIDADVFVVNLFTIGTTHVRALHDRGRYVICAFTAGQWSAELPDATGLPDTVVGAEYTYWQGYYWVDPRAPEVHTWIDAKVEAAHTLGCDGILPRDLDGYDYDTGFAETANDWVALAEKVAAQAHDRGLTVALPGLYSYANVLEPFFDFAWAGDCIAWTNCANYNAFPTAGKLVLNVEFATTEADGVAMFDAVCNNPARAGFSTIIKTWNLTAWRLACP